MKNLNPALAAYVAVRQDYFGANPTKLSLEDLNVEIMNKYDTLPLIDIALVMQLIKTDYETLHAKVTNHNFREHSTMKFPVVAHRNTRHAQLN